MKIKTLLFIPTIGIAISLSSCGGEQTANTESQTETTPATVETKSSTLDLSKGEEIYKAKCVACHQENGQGLADAFPPLANSDYLVADKIRALTGVLMGKTGEITVNGKIFNQEMPANVLTDEEAVDVMNYVLNSWGNKGGTVTIEDVKAARK